MKIGLVQLFKIDFVPDYAQTGFDENQERNTLLAKM